VTSVNGYEKARRMRRELGRELKERRRAAGLSQSELARLTGRSRSLVSTLESATCSAAGLGFWQRVRRGAEHRGPVRPPVAADSA
jgi:predicted XRE-type DNA-binding protein